jgi:hypothetical protein
MENIPRQVNMCGDCWSGDPQRAMGDQQRATGDIKMINEK